jgi:hypothetical protein
MKIGWTSCLAAVLLVMLAVPASGQEINLEEEGLYTTSLLKATATIGAKRLVVIRAATNLRGKLEIVVEPQEDVFLECTKQARTDSKAAAIDYIDLISVSLSQTAEGVRIELRAPNPAPWGPDESGLVTARLVIPEDCIIEIDATYFDIKAEGPILELENTSSLGRQQISNVTRRLKLATANRRVMIENISGEISVATSNAPLTARNLFCEDSEATLRNEGGDITVIGILGGLNVATEYGRIDVEDFRPCGHRSIIRGNSGPVSVEISELRDSRILVHNRFEDIDLMIPAECDVTLALAVDREGKIEVSDMEFKPQMVQPNRLNLVAGDGTNLIRATIQGDGTIHLRGQDEGDSD